MTSRGGALFVAMTTVGIVYLAFHLYNFLVLQPTSAFGAVNGNVTSEHASTPLTSTSTSTTEEGPALLSVANITIASRVILGILTTSLSYLIHLPKVVYFPVKHAIPVLLYTAKLPLRPLLPILAPVFLVVRILLVPLLVPVLLLYKFAVLVYPLYVFLGAAAICGALLGILARRLCKTIVEDVLGASGRGHIRSGVERMASPGRGSSVKVETRRA